ncbi:MAG: T9SS type A sorting domain-containing protein, partial [Bacteroidales bacterium]
DEITVRSSFDGKAVLHLLDMAGRVLLVREITGSETIDLRFLASGIYLIEMAGTDRQTIQRSTLIKE